MKHIFRKNQVIITALAIMIAVAGYLDYVQKNKLENQDAAEASTGMYDMSDISAEDIGEDTTGEAVLVNSKAQTDFFASAKLSREQVRAKNKETLMQMIENVELAEAQKQEAVDAMIALTDVAERENAAEVLLSAKGFSSVVVNIVDDSVDVMVMADSLSDAQVAQIQDIVSRKTEIDIKNMVITPISPTAGTAGTEEQAVDTSAEDTADPDAAQTSGEAESEAEPTSADGTTEVEETSADAGTAESGEGAELDNGEVTED